MHMLNSTELKIWLHEKRVKGFCSANIYVVSQTLTAEKRQLHTRLVSIAHRRAQA